MSSYLSKRSSFSDKDFKHIFEANTVAQWIVDISLLDSLFRRLGINSIEQLEQAIEADSAVLEQLRIDTRIVAANEAVAKLFNCESIDQWRKGITSMMRRTDLINLARAVLAISDELQNLSFQLEATTFNREVKALWLSTQIPARKNLAQGLVVSALDVSIVKAARIKLDDQYQFLNTIIRTLPDILFVYDFTCHKSTFENGDLFKVLGYEENSAYKNTFDNSLIHPDDQLDEQSLDAISEELLGGDVYESTVRFLHADGSWRSYYFRTSALEIDTNNKVKLGLVVARDITELLAVQSGLEKQEQRYRLLAENFSDVVMTTDQDLELNYVSPSVESLLGYSTEDFLAQGQQRFRQLIGWADFEQDIVTQYRAAQHEPMVELPQYDEACLRLYQAEVEHRDGYRIVVEVKISLLRGLDHKLQGLMILCRDISTRLKTEQDLKLAAKVFENSLEGVYISDADGYISQVNQAFARITGYDALTAVGKRPAFLSSGWHGQYFANEIHPVLDKVGYWQGELVNRRSSGEVFPAWVGISVVRGEQDELLGHITSFRDITESKSTQERIHKLAYFDPLTALPNRSLFQDRLSQALQRAERTEANFALLFLDLDRFKAVNDSMGHGIGDQLLKETGERLNHCIRADDTVARMGGDEFTVILSGLANREAAESAAVQVSLKIMDALSKPFLLGGCELFISTSIGISLYPYDGKVEEELLKNADTAMYHAKDNGKNGYQFYTQEMNSRSLERLEMQSSLYKAVHNNEFDMVYQPIFSLDDHQMLGVEALLRWHHPEKGVIEPQEFMVLAKETGLIIKLGEWAIRQACQQMAAWLATGCQLERIAVNVSALQFSDGNLVRSIIDAVDEAGISPSQLELEVTETMLMADFGFSLGMLEDLKALGVRISVDDFGTGSSSLNYLKKLPIDSLKVDQSFVANLGKSTDDQRITRAIIALADSFNLKVIAEGVENPQQARCLLEMGCREAQGHLLGRPSPAAALTTLLLKQAIPS